jgi:iron complex transport system substrate-binding protein
MENGDILYAGKYRAPDYELLLNTGCDIAIENTMLYHEPAVKEKLEELGIPVFIETSSYEKEPLGRLEWIRLYGILFDMEEEADRYFNDQLDALYDILREKPDTGVTAAFFHVTANGYINVRKNGDYITRMIEMAGGSYVPENAGEGSNALSTMNMQAEDFYAGAKDADILIYNSTITGEIGSVDELIALNPMFADFKAVKEGRVYCTERNLFQQTTGIAEFAEDLHNIFTGTERDFTYIYKLD